MGKGGAWREEVGLVNVKLTRVPCSSKYQQAEEQALSPGEEQQTPVWMHIYYVFTSNDPKLDQAICLLYWWYPFEHLCPYS